MQYDGHYYDDDEAGESLHVMEDLQDLPLPEALAIAPDLLGHEETRLPAAFALLDRLKLPAPGDDMAEGAPKLLRLLGRFLGYHPAVLEQVLEALSLGECSGPIIESLPLLVVGAGPEEVAQVVEALKQALQEDLAGLLLPVLGALFDLPLGPRLRREALGLAQEALAVVQDADVPVVVRTLLRTLDEHSDPAILAHIRAECAGLSAQSTAVLMEVLATALSTNPMVARMLLLSIRSSTGAGTITMEGQQQQQLSIVDALVLVLLFSHPAHQPVVQDALLRFLATSPLSFSTTEGAGTSKGSKSSNSSQSIASLLCRLVDFTSDAHWQSLAAPLSELSQWLLLSTLLPPRPRLAQALEPGQQAQALAAHLLRRLFQIHVGLRDEILGFLMTLCVSCGRGTTALEDEEEEQQQTSRTAVLLPLMKASLSILARLAQESPRVLVPYAGMMCDQILNSASVLPAPVMGPLLRALTLLARSHAASGIEITLIIYIQKQLWTNFTSGGDARARSSRSSSSGSRKRMRGGRVSWAVDDMGSDDGRKLTSLVLAEALVFLDKEPKTKQCEGEDEDADADKDDLSGILTWVVRAVPMATPKVAASGLRFLLRVLARQQQQQQRQRIDENRMTRSVTAIERELRPQVEEVTAGLASRLGLVVRSEALMEKDKTRLSYLPLERQIEDVAPVILPWRAPQAPATQCRPPLLPTSKGVLGILLQSYDREGGVTLAKGNSTTHPSLSSPLVWQVEGMVEAFVPRMVASDSVGLGPLFLVKTVVTALLDLQLKALTTAEVKAACFEQLALAPLLLPSWPRAMGRARARQPEGEGPSIWLQSSGQEQGWEEDARLWREGAVTRNKGRQGSKGIGRKCNDLCSSKKSRSRRGKLEGEDDLERLSDGEDEKSDEDDEEEEEEEEEEDDEQDVFRDRCGPKYRWLRAGWGALFAMMVTGPVIEAWTVARKRREGWAAQVPASTLHALLRRHMDLLHRVRRSLERVSLTASAAARHVGGGGGAAGVAIASEPVRVTRSRRRLERALQAYGSTAVGSMRMQEMLLAVLLDWTGEVLGKRSRESSEEAKEEEEEEEEEKEEGEERLAPLLGLVRCLLETMLCRDEQAVALEGQMPLDEEGGIEEGQDGPQQPLWVDDIKLKNVGRMMDQVGRLNRLLRILRRRRFSSALEARDVSRALCLYMAYTRRLCLRAAKQEGSGILIPCDLVQSTERERGGRGNKAGSVMGFGAGASSSSTEAQEQQQQHRLASLGDVARLFMPSKYEVNEESGPGFHEAREYAFGFLAREIEQADDEGVACGLLELLSCMTVGTQKAGSAACFKALHCLETAHPVVDPDMTRVFMCSGIGMAGWGGRGGDSSSAQDSLPVALLPILRPALGLHEVQTRVLLDLRKAALSPSLPLAQRPVLRHFVLTFWSLLPREGRAGGLVRLCEGLQAVFREETEAATEALPGGGNGRARRGRLLQRQHHEGARLYVSSSSMNVPPHEAEHGIRVLRALTPDGAPALLELLLLLSLTTLLLARPQSNARTAAAVTRNSHDERDSLLLGGPYEEVQAALVALCHLMRLIGSGTAGMTARSGRGSARVAAATVKTACLALGGLQWQVERCLAWRTARGGPRETQTPAEEVQERTRDHETDLVHVQRLVEDALAFVGLVADMSEAIKKQQQQNKGGNGGGSSSKTKGKLHSYSFTFHAINQKSAEERWMGVAANLFDRHFVPRCVLACERLVEALRDTSSLLRLPIKIQASAFSFSTQLFWKGKADRKKGQGEEGGELWQGRLVRKESRSALLMAFMAAERKSEGNHLRVGIVGGRGKQKEKDEGEGEGWEEMSDDEERSIDLGEEEEDEDEDEDEDEEQFYALMSDGGSLRHGQGVSNSTQRCESQGDGRKEEEHEQEVDEDEDDDCGPRRRRRSGTCSPLRTPKVVVGGGTNATVTGSDDGTLVVQFRSNRGYSEGKRRRRS